MFRTNTLISLVCLFSVHISAQVPGTFLSLKKYSTTEGLSSPTAVKIAEDPYGFIWIATHDGLNRFDGTTFIHFNKNTAEHLSGNDVSAIAVDTFRNIIWTATSLGGLDAIDLRTLKVIKRFLFNTKGSVVMNDWVLSIIPSGNELWLGTNNGLFIYDVANNSVQQRVTDPDQISGKEENIRYDKLIYSSHSTITALINNRVIALYSIKERKSITAQPVYDATGKATLIINDIIAQDKTSVLAATSKGIKRLVWHNPTNSFQADLSSQSAFSFISGSSVQHISLYKNTELWLSSTEGIFRADINNKSVTKVQSFSKSKNDGWEKTVNQLFMDSNNNIWLCTSGGVIVSSTRPSPFAPVRSLNNNMLSLGRCFNVNPTPASDYFISTETGLIIADSSFSNGIKTDDGVFYYSLAQVMDRSLAFTSAGIKLIENKHATSPLTVFPELKNIAGEKIGCWLQVNDGLVLLASFVNKGIWKWDLKEHKLNYIGADPENGSGTDQINSLYRESDNSILIVYLSKIFRYDISTGSLTGLPINEKPANCIFYDIRRSGNYYFIGTYGDGILIYNKDFKLVKHLTDTNGLPNNNICNLFPFNDSIILASTNFGAALINIATFAVHPLLISDGLSSNNFECDFRPGINNHKFFLPTTDGITLVQPAYFIPSARSPKFYFSKISITSGGKITDSTDLDIFSITIPSNFLRTVVHFSGIQFPDPERIQYKYKIEELGADWIDGGNKNYVELIGISHGTYHLQVQAFNEDRIGSEIKELVIIILPKWYQTWWFRLLLGLLFIVIVYGIYRIRIHQLKKEENIRNQLAKDLHDDLGSTLNSIKVHSNLAMMEKENPEHLAHVKEGAQDAISGVRDIIWVLDDKKDTVEDMLVRVSQFARPLCAANKINYTVETDEDAKELRLGKEEKRNLYLVFKETINNSLKYAECRNILLKSGRVNKKIRFEISDDGKGFDKAQETGGYGLKNITSRAEAIGYSCTLITNPGNGVKLVLEKK